MKVAVEPCSMLRSCWPMPDHVASFQPSPHESDSVSTQDVKSGRAMLSLKGAAPES